MAETKTKAVKAAPKSAAAVKAPAEEAPQVLEAPEKEAPKQAYKVRKQLDPHTIVTVKNGFPGMLIYESSKTGEMFRWESLGDEQDMELQELKNARNASKAFYVNNWFRIDDPEILDYLGVGVDDDDVVILRAERGSEQSPEFSGSYDDCLHNRSGSVLRRKIVFAFKGRGDDFDRFGLVFPGCLKGRFVALLKPERKKFENAVHGGGSAFRSEFKTDVRKFVNLRDDGA